MGKGGKAHADDVLTRDSRDPVKLPTPGKESRSSGEEWETQGACVRDNPGVDGCYLSNQARENLLRQIHSRADARRTNYKLAASELKTTTRLQKDADFSFLPTLYKEFLTATFIGAITKGVINLRGGTKDTVELITDDAIRNITRSLGGYGAKRVDGEVKRDAHAADEKHGKLAYLDVVQNDVDAYFDELLLGLPEATDTQLQLLFEGFAPALGTVDILRAQLDDKLKRFVQSGVLKIGRSWDQARGEDYKTNMERRVVRINVGGREELFYQHHEQRWGAGRGDEAFGTVHGRNQSSSSTYWGERVPDEFKTQALAASEAKWGPTPLMLLKPAELRALTGRVAS